MKILVTGSRDWEHASIIHIALADAIRRHYYVDDVLAKPKRKDILIIHGAARGADTIAANWADSRGVLHTKDRYRVPNSDWKRLGKVAGILRNHRMLDENADIDIVLAFWKNRSRGTRDMIEYATSRGYKVIIYEE